MPEMPRMLKERLPEILPEGKIRWLGVKPLGANGSGDALIELRIARRRLKLLIDFLSQPNLARVRDHCAQVRARARRLRDAVPVLVAPSLNEEMRRRCVAEGVRYIDLSGNVWLEEGSVLIKKAVPKNLYPHQSKERSPFADKASLVLRYLIGRREAAGIRQIARAVDLDPGYVSRVVRAAAELGYASSDSRGRARLRNVEEMLSDWSVHYSWRQNDCRALLWLRQEKEALGDVLKRRLRSLPEESYALSLHAGNNQVEPFASYDVWHIYARDGAVLERLMTLRGVQPSPPDAGNIAVMKPHYPQSAFYGARLVAGIRVVSDVQLYLDLRRFPIRGVEAAEHILERRLRPLWEER